MDARDAWVNKHTMKGAVMYRDYQKHHAIVITVGTVDGGLVKHYWREPMTIITTTRGVFIDYAYNKSDWLNKTGEMLTFTSDIIRDSLMSARFATLKN